MAKQDVQIGLSSEVRSRLSRFKESPMTWDDLLRDMAEVYENHAERVSEA